MISTFILAFYKKFLLSSIQEERFTFFFVRKHWDLEIFDFRFLKDLPILELLECNLIIFGKCLYLSVRVRKKICGHARAKVME